MTTLNKIRYSRDELLVIRDTILAVDDASRRKDHHGKRGSVGNTSAQHALPTFAEPSSNAVDFREALFGASSHPSSRRAGGSGHHSGAQSMHEAKATALWVYRTKGGSKNSNPMPLADIQQLVADELVDEHEIELMLRPDDDAGGVTATNYVSLQEAVAMLEHVGAPPPAAEVSPVGAVAPPAGGAGGDRWQRSSNRPGRGLASSGSTSASQSAGGSISNPAPAGAANPRSAPSKHHGLCRDDMMTVEDGKPKLSGTTSPSLQAAVAATPPPLSSVAPPTAASLLMLSPIGEEDSSGSGNSSAAKVPAPRPPCALDVDEVLPVASLRSAPVPISCVDDESPLEIHSPEAAAAEVRPAPPMALGTFEMPATVPPAPQSTSHKSSKSKGPRVVPPPPAPSVLAPIDASPTLVPNPADDSSRSSVSFAKATESAPAGKGKTRRADPCASAPPAATEEVLPVVAAPSKSSKASKNSNSAKGWSVNASAALPVVDFATVINETKSVHQQPAPTAAVPLTAKEEKRRKQFAVQIDADAFPSLEEALGSPSSPPAHSSPSKSTPSVGASSAVAQAKKAPAASPQATATTTTSQQPVKSKAAAAKQQQQITKQFFK